MPGVEEIETGRNHVRGVRLEDCSLPYQQIEVALPGRVKAVPGSACQGTAGLSHR